MTLSDRENSANSRENFASVERSSGKTKTDLIDERNESTCSRRLQQAARFNKDETMSVGDARTSCIVALSDTSRFNSSRSIFHFSYFFSCFSRKVKICSRAQTEGRPNCCSPPPFRPYEGPVRSIMIQTCWRRLCGCASPSEGSSCRRCSVLFVFFFSLSLPLSLSLLSNRLIILMIDLKVITVIKLKSGTHDNRNKAFFSSKTEQSAEAIQKNTCAKHSCDRSYRAIVAFYAIHFLI